MKDHQKTHTGRDVVKIVISLKNPTKHIPATPLRVLYFLEPVIYRNAPAGLAAHFLWVDTFIRAARLSGGSFTLCANQAVWECWQRAQSISDLSGFHIGFEALDPFEVLTDYGYERAQYSKATYDNDTSSTNALGRRLAQIRVKCRPDVVVLSAQNAIAMQAFHGLHVLCIEQASLPRLGQPIRTMVDPCGHQVGSTLERFADRIRTMRPPERHRPDLTRLYDAVIRSITDGDPRATAALTSLNDLRIDGAPLALLVTQPTDAVTFEGAGHAAELENILFEWASSLPPGWVGVPTYHAGQRLNGDMESALARACPRLRFLPTEHSQGLTEVLLVGADGMVTVSSTAAMTGLLLGKRVVVTGKSPFTPWCASRPSELETASVLDRNQAESLLCFLTNRYAHPMEVWQSQPDSLATLIRRITEDKRPKGEWLLDASDWTLGGALPLFKFRFCVAAGKFSESLCMRQSLESDLTQVRLELDVVRQEWSAARLGKDKIRAELAHTEAHLASYKSEWQAAVADRDRLLRELEISRAAFALERQGWAESHAKAVAQGASAQAELERELGAKSAALEAAQTARDHALEQLAQECATGQSMRADIAQAERRLGELNAALAAQQAEQQLLSSSTSIALENAQRRVEAAQTAQEDALKQLAQECATGQSMRTDIAQAERRLGELNAALAAQRAEEQLLRSSTSVAIENAQRREQELQAELTLAAAESQATAELVKQGRIEVAQMASHLQSAEQAVQRLNTDIQLLQLQRAQDTDMLARCRSEHQAQLAWLHKSIGKVIADRNSIGKLLVDELDRVHANENAFRLMKRAHTGLLHELDDSRQAWMTERTALTQTHSTLEMDLRRLTDDSKQLHAQMYQLKRSACNRLLRAFSRTVQAFRGRDRPSA
jgi:hypothetical protein